MSAQATTKERPILFSAEMVRALRAGRKTQTRRVVKFDAEGAMMVRLDRWVPSPTAGPRCPYGQPGDWLWVREAWQSFGDSSAVVPPVPLACQIRYGADGAARWCPVPAGAKGNFPASLKARPSIHMPRWASRLTLEITGVRVERLQDISVADAWAEGATPGRMDAVDAMIESREPAQIAYEDLWESINGPGSWELNPWVWVVEFKVLEGGAR